ncbi:MAG: undecaprenyldiphospho-muramoylpentapeptide beta-N-acetylglucosaminyltransferase [Gammaproteobacteria bacterium]|nr:undecaprenyldiphospho-muramoylpentapeptide beta-N-acetylglucosaminyltransferase [Gammaproteobacteria bacterium]
MSNNERKILIMAGGTGGHIFPALSIAEKLQHSGAKVEWLGAIGGLETRIVGETDIPLHVISVKGLRGKGLLPLVLAPFMIIKAVAQALGVMRKVKPDCVLGMGGFVTGPGGVAAVLSGRKLLIHEQNAVPGVTNKMLSVVARKVLVAFPGAFKAKEKVEFTGNPVRQSIILATEARRDRASSNVIMHILVLGGSQGAVAINEVIPPMLALWKNQNVPHVIHQTGRLNLDDTLALYRTHSMDPGEQLKVTGFIDDMAEAFAWADVVICRSGASTVCELAVAGLPAILVPYPYHKDNQQTKNAQWLSDADAAILIQQVDLSPELLMENLAKLDEDRSRLTAMSNVARALGTPDASTKIANRVLEAANG